MELDGLAALAQSVLEAGRARGWLVTTAESCTGGMVAMALTEIAGSSDVFERGFVTYANEAKREMLGVPENLLARFGAVSEEVARAMAEGALAHASRATLSVAITGVAGPGGGTAEKPVGLVYIASAVRGAATRSERHLFKGGRHGIRVASAARALSLLLERAKG
jgi:nicotinamide-nucleotide amidase